MGKLLVPKERTKEDLSDLRGESQCYLFYSSEEVNRGAEPRTIKILTKHG